MNYLMGHVSFDIFIINNYCIRGIFQIEKGLIINGY